MYVSQRHDTNRELRAGLAGVVWGMASLVLLASLVFALAYASDIANVVDNLQWYLAGSTVAAMAIGGFIAGWNTGNGVRGWRIGTSAGGAMLLVTALVGVPAIIGTGSMVSGVGRFIEVGGPMLNTVTWSGFSAAIAGLAAAALTGMWGGAVGENAYRDRLAEEEAAFEAEERRRPQMRAVPPRAAAGTKSDEGLRRSGTDI